MTNDMHEIQQRLHSDGLEKAMYGQGSIVRRCCTVCTAMRRASMFQCTIALQLSERTLEFIYRLREQSFNKIQGYL